MKNKHPLKENYERFFIDTICEGKTITIRGVSVGDKFKNPSNKSINEVVDILEQKSLVSNDIIGYVCIAKGMNTIATNTFEVPFATVQRFKIN